MDAIFRELSKLRDQVKGNWALNGKSPGLCGGVRPRHMISTRMGYSCIQARRSVLGQTFNKELI